MKTLFLVLFLKTVLKPPKNLNVPNLFCSWFSLINFSYILETIFNVKLRVLWYLVSFYIHILASWPDDNPSSGSKLDAT